MRAILIDPFNKTVTAVETPGALQDIYNLIGCTTICAIQVDRKHHMYLDDNGLIHEEKLPVFEWQGYPQPLAGRGLIFGTDRSNEAAATMPLGVAETHVTFPALEVTEITTRTYTRDDGTFVVENRPRFKRTGKD